MTSEPRRTATLTLVAIGAAFAYAGPAWADACDSQPTSNNPLYQRIPDCELQVQKQLYFPQSYTSGWAFYCTGDHPYYWGYQYSFWPSFTWDDSCFTVSENIFFEGPSKFDATLTNWCVRPENIVVTLACSSQPPPQL